MNVEPKGLSREHMLVSGLYSIGSVDIGDISCRSWLREILVDIFAVEDSDEGDCVGLHL